MVLSLRVVSATDGDRDSDNNAAVPASEVCDLAHLEHERTTPLLSLLSDEPPRRRPHGLQRKAEAAHKHGRRRRCHQGRTMKMTSASAARRARAMAVTRATENDKLAACRRRRRRFVSSGEASHASTMGLKSRGKQPREACQLERARTHTHSRDWLPRPRLVHKTN